MANQRAAKVAGGPKLLAGNFRLGPSCFPKSDITAPQRTTIEALLCDLPAVLGHFERRLAHDVR